MQNGKARKSLFTLFCEKCGVHMNITMPMQRPLRQGWYRVSEPGLRVLTPAPSEATDSVTQSRRHGGQRHAERDSVIKLQTSEKLKHKVTKN